MRAAVGLALICLALAPGLRAQEVISVNAAGPATPFPHFWEQVVGSGRAVLSLRQSYRDDLHQVRQATSIRYVRFHAILHDENGVYDVDPQGHPVYNFSYVDQIYDGLLEAGMRPYVEISFMPAKLAASQSPHAFWYRPLPSPPADMAKWTALIDAFTRHLVDRYGLDEVAQWYFEVWNEPNIDFWTGEPKQATYFQLYDATATAIKQVSPRLRVGGPATAQAAWIDVFIQHCVDHKVPVDFVSTHVYANDLAKDVFGTNETIPRHDMVSRSVKKVFDQVKHSPRPDLPIHWSEYNASYKNEVDVTDSSFMGPWLANNIRQSQGMTTLMSYWCFSDVFEEQGIVKTPFYGGFGMLAERSIPKASFNAFAMLHRLGDRLLPVGSENALATRHPDGSLAIAVWNYAEPEEAGVPRQFRLALSAAQGPARITILDADHGTSLTAFQKMSAPPTPTRAQITALRKAGALPPPRPIDLQKPFTLAPKSLALIEVGR
jgi:xylan 1,4-beta-xylosidase